MDLFYFEIIIIFFNIVNLISLLYLFFYSTKNGDNMERGCDERCTCNRGEWICTPRCMGKMFKRGTMMTEQPNCHEILAEDDVCCSSMECNSDADDIHNNNGISPTVATFSLSEMNGK